MCNKECFTNVKLLRSPSTRENWTSLHMILTTSATSFLHGASSFSRLLEGQSFSPTFIPTQHVQSSPLLSFTRFSPLSSEEIFQILSCNPTTCLLDPFHNAPDHFTGPPVQLFYHSVFCILYFLYSHPKETHSGYLRHQHLPICISSFVRLFE